MAIDSIKGVVIEKIRGIGVSPTEFFVNFLIAILLVIAGIFVGKLIKFGLRKLLEKLRIQKIIKQVFVNLFLIIIKWSIYVLFIDLALIQLDIPLLTNWLTTILGVIPALTGALIIISVGFAIAVYLKNIITESRMQGWQILSQIFFFFIIYIFMIFASKTALVSLKDKLMANILVVIFTLLGGVSLIVYYFKFKK